MLRQGGVSFGVCVVRRIFLCVYLLLFVLFNMAAYTLPEGFTDFDMFTFGTALLVGGKWREWRRQRACVTFKGAAAVKRLRLGSSLESLSIQY